MRRISEEMTPAEIAAIELADVQEEAERQEQAATLRELRADPRLLADYVEDSYQLCRALLRLATEDDDMTPRRRVWLLQEYIADRTRECAGLAPLNTWPPEE